MSFTGLDRYRMDFDGTDDYIACGNGVSFDITDDITMACWVKSSTLPTTGGQETIMGRDDSTNRNYTLYIQEGSGNVKFFWDYLVSDALQRVSSSTNLSVDTWYHVVCTRDITTGKNIIYVNGVAEQTHTDSTSSIDNDNVQFAIGARGNGANFFEGSIGQVAIWNTALTQPEVTTLYASGDRSGDWTTMQNSSQVGHWRLGIDDIGIGKHLRLDGGSDYLIIPDHADFNITTNLTVSCWAKNISTALSSGENLVSKWLVSGDERSWALGFNTSEKLYFLTSDDGASDIRTETSASAVLIGQWNHYVVTYQGGSAPGTVLIYINGIKVSSATTDETDQVAINSGTSPVEIGASNGAGNPWGGDIGQVTIHSSVLTPHQITQMYLEGRHANWQTNFSTGMAGYWRMGSGTGDSMVGGAGGLSDFHHSGILDQTSITFGSNLLSNETFENNITGFSGVGCTPSQSTEQSYSGSSSLKFTATGNDQGIASTTFTTVTDAWYQLRFFLYSTINFTDNIRIFQYEGDGSGEAMDCQTQVLPSNGEWQEYIAYVKEKSGGSSATIKITNNNNGAGDYYIDNITFRKLTSKIAIPISLQIADQKHSQTFQDVHLDRESDIIHTLGDELLDDADFEDIGTDEWQDAQASGSFNVPFSDISKDSDIKHSGSQSLKIFHEASSSSAVAQSYNTLVVGYIYKVSGWVRADSTTVNGDGFDIRFDDSNELASSNPIYAKLFNSTEGNITANTWTYSETYYTSIHTNFTVGIWARQNGGYIWLDDWSVKRVAILNHGEGVNMEDTDIELDATVIDETSNNNHGNTHGYYKVYNETIRSTNVPT